MNKLRTLAIISLIAALSNHSHADAKKTAKQARAFAIPTLVGAFVGGPAGLMVGVISGVALSQHAAKKYDEKILIEREWAERKQAKREAAEKEAAKQGEVFATIEAKMQLKMELETPILFDINSDQLPADSIYQLEKIAGYLKKHADKTVILNAYADPVGTREYNKILSKRRAHSVAETLKNYGISDKQIETYAHGERADHDNMDLFVFERRVDISFQSEFDHIATTK